MAQWKGNYNKYIPVEHFNVIEPIKGEKVVLVFPRPVPEQAKREIISRLKQLDINYCVVGVGTKDEIYSR